jgi:[ribosomal protein S18]-alanine N-acetyltransferase
MSVAKPPAGIVLREMTARDLDEVRRIERAAYTDAWSRRVFEQELRNGFSRYVVAVLPPEPTAPGAPERAPAARGPLAGLRERFRGRPPEPLGAFAGVWYMVDQLHLVTIAVDPPLQGRGLGQRLLLEVYRLAVEAELGSVVLEVRVSNAHARALYERYAFRPTGTLRDYYKDNHEDALVMQTPPLDSPEARATLDRLESDHRARHPELWGE